MTKLKLSEILDDKPVKVTVELPARLHRDLVAYAQVLGGETGSLITDPVRLIAPMVERFIATDRGSDVPGGKRDDVGGQRRLVLAPAGDLALCRAVLPEDSARPPLGDADGPHDVLDTCPTTGGAQ